MIVITHEPAAVANILPNQYNMGGNGTIWPSLSGQYASYASVEFSTSTLSVKAGQKSTFTAIFTPPTDIPDRYLPVYSGMIKITNNNDEFTVTYIGQPYSRFKADYIEATNDTGVLLPALLAPGSYDITDAIRDIGVYTFADWTAFPSFDWVTMQSIQYFRVDLVPYNTSFVPNFYGFIKTEDNPQGVPARYLPLQYPNPTELPLLTTDENAGLLETYGIWDDDENLTHPSAFLWGFGNYANGWKLPNGDYRALLRVLRWNGDWLKEKDYQSWLSPVIRVQYK
jgi:hypothetical protein